VNEPTSQKTYEIPNQLQRLENNIVGTLSLIDALRSRISQIMAPATPSSKCENEKAGAVIETQFGSFLDVQNDKIEEANRAIEVMLQLIRL